ncbi:hypothetical protein Vi05172_g12135 [Venturia inaequalis]|nr:hypothetical protein Vi05172_g12135 [Venturia inaequalis]
MSKKDTVLPQHLPEEFHDRSGVSDMTDRNNDVLPPQDPSALIIDTPKLDEAADDATKLGEAQASSVVSSPREESGSGPGIVRANPNNTPSSNQVRSLSPEKVENTEAMQPPINSPILTTTIKPDYTPASRFIYSNAVKKLETIKSEPEVHLEGSETEPPAYMDVERSDRNIHLAQRRRIFNSICESVGDLDIKKLSAQDYEVSPCYEGEWYTWIQTIFDSMMTIRDVGTNVNLVHEDFYNKYGSQIEAGVELIEQELESILSRRQRARPEDTERVAWAHDQMTRYRQFLKSNGIDLDKHTRIEAHDLLHDAIRDVLLCVFAKYRVEALLELCPREHGLDNWLHHQMDVCDEWFKENDKHLGLLHDTGKRLKALWISELWSRWDDFLMNGFDPVLAEMWEPPLLAVLLDSQPQYIQDMNVGAYPPETLLEEGHGDIETYCLGYSSEDECGLYEANLFANYRVDIMLTPINDTPHVVAASEEGYVLAHIPPPYRENGEKGRVRMKDLVSELLSIEQSKDAIMTWLNRAIVEGRLDTSTVEWIKFSIQESDAQSYAGEEDSENEF